MWETHKHTQDNKGRDTTEENKPLAGWQPVSNAIRCRLQLPGVTLDSSLLRQKYEPEEPCGTLI